MFDLAPLYGRIFLVQQSLDQVDVWCACTHMIRLRIAGGEARFRRVCCHVRWSFESVCWFDWQVFYRGPTLRPTPSAMVVGQFVNVGFQIAGSQTKSAFPTAN